MRLEIGLTVRTERIRAAIDRIRNVPKSN